MTRLVLDEMKVHHLRPTLDFEPRPVDRPVPVIDPLVHAMAEDGHVSSQVSGQVFGHRPYSAKQGLPALSRLDLLLDEETRLEAGQHFVKRMLDMAGHDDVVPKPGKELGRKSERLSHRRSSNVSRVSKIFGKSGSP